MARKSDIPDDAPKTQSPSGSKPPGKRERKKAERAALLTSLRDGDSVTSAEAHKIAKKVGIDLSFGTASDPALADATQYDPFKETQKTRSAINRTESLLDDYDKARVLSYLEMGMNRSAAVKSSNMDWSRFYRTLQRDEQFRNDVILAENSTVGRCASIIYEQALNSDISAAEKYINVINRINAGTFTRKMNLADHRLKRQLADHATGKGGVKEERPNVNAIPPECWDDFNGLADRVQRGEELTDAEYIRHGRYLRLITLASQKDRPLDPLAVLGMINGARSDEKE